MGIRTRRAHRHSRTHIVGFGIAGVFGFLALLVIALAVSMGSIVDSWLKDLPDYDSADAYLVSEPTTVFDANGTVIAEYYAERTAGPWSWTRYRRTWCPAPSTRRTSASTSTTASTPRA